MRGMAREYAAGNARRPDWREFAGTFGWPDGGSVADRSSGREWNRSQPCQGATELGFPRPAQPNGVTNLSRRSGKAYGNRDGSMR